MKTIFSLFPLAVWRAPLPVALVALLRAVRAGLEVAPPGEPAVAPARAPRRLAAQLAALLPALPLLGGGRVVAGAEVAGLGAGRGGRSGGGSGLCGSGASGGANWCGGFCDGSGSCSGGGSGDCGGGSHGSDGCCGSGHRGCDCGGVCSTGGQAPEAITNSSVLHPLCASLGPACPSPAV